MKFERTDLKHLQAGFLLLAASLLVAGGALWGAQRIKQNAEQGWRNATATEQGINNTLSRARSEEQQLRAMIGRFQALKERGIVGAEQRLDWVETLARIKSERRLARLDYEFAPQRPLDAGILPGGPAAGSFQLMSSTMHLTLSLLHEGDLLGVLDDLRKVAPALIQVRACRIERATHTPTERSASANLTAECSLEWITLKEAK